MATKRVRRLIWTGFTGLGTFQTVKGKWKIEFEAYTKSPSRKEIFRRD
jgi:hypothetical protein